MADLTGLAETLVATSGTINAKSVAITALYTVPAGKSFIATKVVIRVASNYNGAGKTTQATVSFGGNAATYDDFINSEAYTVAAASKYIVDHAPESTGPTTALPIYAAASSFRCSVEIGSDATTEDWVVDLFGYLV